MDTHCSPFPAGNTWRLQSACQAGKQNVTVFISLNLELIMSNMDDAFVVCLDFVFHWIVWQPVDYVRLLVCVTCVSWGSPPESAIYHERREQELRYWCKFQIVLFEDYKCGCPSGPGVWDEETFLACRPLSTVSFKACNHSSSAGCNVWIMKFKFFFTFTVTMVNCFFVNSLVCASYCHLVSLHVFC